MMENPLPSSKRDAALHSLDHIRTLIASGDLRTASERIAQLQKLVDEWQTSAAQDIADARKWLDEALNGDLLLFNADAAQEQLNRWQSAAYSVADPELEQYRTRVNEHTARKKADLQARGVIAYCEELLRKGAELETGEQPAHPDFVLSNYYTRARDVAAAARAEHKDSAELDALSQKTERLQRHKAIAARVYVEALTTNRYSAALSDLDKLPLEMPIPRYQLLRDDKDSSYVSFDRLIKIDEARSELTSLARTWAEAEAARLQADVKESLEAFDPQTALAALQGRSPDLNLFVDKTTRNTLSDLEMRAANDVQRMEQAEAQAQNALKLVDENPLEAWNLYEQARSSYAGAPTLQIVHQTLIPILSWQLENFARQAEEAINNKDMLRAQQICQSARYSYADKDPALEEWIARLDDLGTYARSYAEYLRSARQIFDQIKSGMDADITAANELLNQLENYPPIILEELPDFTQTRLHARRRMNADTIYQQLADLIYSSDLSTVQSGVSAATTAVGEITDDTRLRRLLPNLETHLKFLQARAAHEAGEVEQALALYQQVATSEGHVDQPAARAFVAQLGSAMRE